MIRRPKYLTALAAALLLTTAGSAGATQYVYELHDHPDGGEAPPTYGLRLDNLLSIGVYSFSFDYVDGTGAAAVALVYDDVAGTVHISGRAFGGKHDDDGYREHCSGWVNIDFTYNVNVAKVDDCGGDGGDGVFGYANAGDDIYCIGEDLSNSGSVTLDGWGDDRVFQFSDKADGTGCSFIFDNDTDSKGNGSIEADPKLFSGSGWLRPGFFGSRDWLFVGEMRTVPTENTTWGSLKSQWQ